MTIKIKSWRDGSVLYTAKDAADIKTAVEEAVVASARFQGYGFTRLRS